jgi:hypothetical protein
MGIGYRRSSRLRKKSIAFNYIRHIEKILFLFFLYSLFLREKSAFAVLNIGGGKDRACARRAKETFMKNKLLSMGMSAGLLTFALVMFGCEHNARGGGGGGDSDLVAKWYLTQDAANAGDNSQFGIEFKADGTIALDEEFGVYTTSGNKITITLVETISCTYFIIGTKLNIQFGDGESIDFYKKAQ